MQPLPQVVLEGPAVVIADLHLDAFDEARSTAFQAWVRGLPNCTLFILGDLFDAWVGPAHEDSPGAQIVIAALREFVERGCQVHVLKGNRDFLLGNSFAACSRSQVHPEGLVVRLAGGASWLFLHGDELCTQDRSYQRLRRLTHSSLMQNWGPRVPLFVSKRVAARLRRYSSEVVPLKLSEHKAIQEGAALSQARAADCAGLLCGHVHRARDQDLGEGRRWLILDAFDAGKLDAVRIAADGEVSRVSSADVSRGDSIQ